MSNITIQNASTSIEVPPALPSSPSRSLIDRVKDQFVFGAQCVLAVSSAGVGAVLLAVGTHVSIAFGLCTLVGSFLFSSYLAASYHAKSTNKLEQQLAEQRAVIESHKQLLTKQEMAIEHQHELCKQLKLDIAEVKIMSAEMKETATVLEGVATMMCQYVQEFGNLLNVLQGLPLKMVAKEVPVAHVEAVPSPSTHSLHEEEDAPPLIEKERSEGIDNTDIKVRFMGSIAPSDNPKIEERFVRRYEVNGCPMFDIVDKDGNIINR